MRKMGAPARTKEKGQEALSSKTKVIVIGLVLAVIGSVISSSYAKATDNKLCGLWHAACRNSRFCFWYVCNGYSNRRNPL